MRCEKCGKTLSSSNPGPFCFAHSPGNLVYEHVPVTSVSSTEHFRGDHDFDLRPGDPGFNELAFVRELQGVIDENGEFVDLDTILS